MKTNRSKKSNTKKPAGDPFMDAPMTRREGQQLIDRLSHTITIGGGNFTPMIENTSGSGQRDGKDSCYTPPATQRAEAPVLAQLLGILQHELDSLHGLIGDVTGTFAPVLRSPAPAPPGTAVAVQQTPNSDTSFGAQLLACISNVRDAKSRLHDIRARAEV